MHRGARLLKQQSLFFANQRKQTSVFRFRFPFAENQWKLPFSVYL
jgi:hypothetical protein